MSENSRSPHRSADASLVWDAVFDAILIVDDGGIIDDCNRSTEVMLGYERHELVGAPIGRFLPDLAAIGDGGRAGSEAPFYEKRLRDAGPDPVARRRDGSELPIQLALRNCPGSGRSRLACVVRDRSAEKRAEDRLRQREEQLELTIRFAPTGIATLDLDGRFLTINDAFRSMVGHSEQELVHKPVNSITHPDDVAMAEARLQELREGRVDHYRMQKRYLRKDGSVLEAMLSASVVHDSEGVPLLYVAQTEDLTERLEAEKNASELREKLAHVTRLHALGEMAAGIAHEINQPLTAIATYAQASRRMIEAGMASSDEVLDAMDKINRQAQRAAGVIKSLRALGGKRPSAKQIVDLHSLIREVVQLAEVDARTHDATIRLELADGLPRVLADPVQIQQVILNLLRNGMEASANPECSDKSLLVRTRLTAEDSVQVSIEDRGMGITDEAEKSLFRAFFTTKTSGMGMGLAICRSIVNAHGGNLWFTRNPDGGTNFHLSIAAVVGEQDATD